MKQIESIKVVLAVLWYTSNYYEDKDRALR